MNLRFDERVVVITGAGQGLGRAYALEFARRGARVVVNDIASSNGAALEAQTVAEEIRAGGGEAVISTDSVEDGNRIVECALDAFGRVDVLINNAGVLRNNSLLKMSEEDWDIVYRVHLLGTMRVTKAAWRYLREAHYGRVIVTTSNAGYFGSLGAANYAAAKAGTIAFAQTLALEGATRNIKVNAVAPMAGSRLTAAIWPETVSRAFTPDLVAPAVAFLCHESCAITGRVFEIGGGWVSELRWEQSPGVLFDRGVSAEDVAARWSEIEHFDGAEKAPRANDYIQRIRHMTGETVRF